MRTQLRSTRVSAEPGKRNLRVKVGSVKRISVLNLTRVTKGYPVQMLHVSVLGSVIRAYNASNLKKLAVPEALTYSILRVFMLFADYGVV